MTQLDIPRPERCVVVVDQGLPAGLAANAAAVLALSLGARCPGLPGPDFRDAQGVIHPGLIPMGLPILAAPVWRLAALRHAAAADAQLVTVDFPAPGQQTTDYTAFVDAVGTTPATDLAYLGVAVCGRSKAVRKLTGDLPLLR